MKFKKHIIISIIFLFIIFVFLFGYVVFNFFLTNYETNYELSDENKFFFGKTVRKGKINECNNYPEKIQSAFGSVSYPRGACISVFANKMNDVGLCDKITEKKAKIICIYNYAHTKKDAKVCNLLSKYSTTKGYDCLTSLARRLRNSDICKNIKFKKEKQHCIEMVNKVKDSDVGDEEIKNKIDSCGHRRCVYDIVVRYDKPDLCTLFPDISDYLNFQYDYFNCITEIASKNNFSICENLKTEKQINKCYYYSAINDFRVISDY